MKRRRINEPLTAVLVFASGALACLAVHALQPKAESDYYIATPAGPGVIVEKPLQKGEVIDGVAGWEPGSYSVRYVTVEATGYAPLDSQATKGVCYSGDPRVTASGAKTKPGVTVAADRSIPFGTRIFIPSHGLRIVEDRGGAIRGNKIDICFKTRDEALRFGRRQVQVMVFERI